MKMLGQWLLPSHSAHVGPVVTTITQRTCWASGYYRHTAHMLGQWLLPSHSAHVGPVVTTITQRTCWASGYYHHTAHMLGQWLAMPFRKSSILLSNNHHCNSQFQNCAFHFTKFTSFQILEIYQFLLFV